MYFSGVGHFKNPIPNDPGTTARRRRNVPRGLRQPKLEAYVKILVLAGHHVRELLPYRECADVMRKALAELARGQIQQPLRTIVRPRDAAGFMALMPAYSPAAGYGLKAICVTPGNPAIGKDAHQGGVLLFAADTGEPLAMVNASAVTEIRTAATSAVATATTTTAASATSAATSQRHCWRSQANGCNCQ